MAKGGNSVVLQSGHVAMKGAGYSKILTWCLEMSHSKQLWVAQVVS